MPPTSRPPRDSGICVYDHFDEDTYEPLNDQTRIRLEECGLTETLLAGRTVLDIGCNSGLLGYRALQLGATHVTAYDVQPHLVEQVADHARRKNLPMTVDKKALADLTPDDAADVVLFFEVLHWAVAQGMTIAEALAKVAMVTLEAAVLEFPWDVEEPSIRQQTNLTPDDYSAALVFEHLTELFDTVEFVRFMTYFGSTSTSRRALVIVRKGDTAVPSTVVDELRRQLPDLTSVRPLATGRSWRKVYVNTARGEVLVKQVAPESELWRLPPDRLDPLLDALETSCPTIASPLRLDGDRRITIEGEIHYAFEWIGDPPAGATPPRRPRPSLDDHLALARRLTAELASVDPSIRADLASTTLPYLPDPGRLGELLESMADALGATPDDTRTWVDAANTLTSTDCTHLVHGDLNTSNIVADHAGSLRVVDIDNLRLGSPYTDTLWVLGFMGAPRDAYDAAIDDLRATVGGLRPPARHDVVQAIGILTPWLDGTQDAAETSTRVSQQRARVFGGTGTLLTWARDTVPG